MPSLSVMAAMALVVDVLLLVGFLYISFTTKDLPFPSRVIILRRLLGASVVLVVPLYFFRTAALPLLHVLVVANGLLMIVAIVLFWLKPKQGPRKRDPAWYQKYAVRLENELMEHREIEKELAFIAAMSERDPNCVVELSSDGQLGYRNPATDQTFPDIREKGLMHPALSGLQDVLHILQCDKKTSLRRPFRFGERVFEQQITWSEETRKLSIYMTDVTEWKRLDQLKTELLNTVSHEFRTPLSGILATTSMIQSEMLGPVSAEQKKMLAMTTESANRLNRMISDLLDISKIEAGKFELRRDEMELTDLVRNVALSFTPLAQDRGIEIATDIDPLPIYCLGDSDKIIQVLTNLVNNALKFTCAGRVTLSVRATAADVRFAVQDTGIGIPSNQMHRVFGKFQQFGAAVKGEKGTGLGLSLCKNIVELHGGKITVDSVVGQGTTFSFVVPKLSAQTVFDEALRRLYETAAIAGQCLSAFVLTLDDASETEPFEGKIDLARKLEVSVRQHIRSDQDMALREQNRVFFILNAIGKKEAKTIVDKLILDLKPAVIAAGALQSVIVRAQFTSLPDDGTILEGLQSRLAA